VVDINNREAVNGDRRVEAVDLLAAADAVIRIVYAAVAVLIDHVLGDDGEVADVGLKIWVTCIVAVGVEDEEPVGAAFVSDCRDVDTGGSELLGEDIAVLKGLEIDQREASSLAVA
jgi:hypothetical protein